MRLGLLAKWTVVVLVLFVAASAAAESVFVYKKPKAAHPGKEATPLEAYALMQQDPEHSYIVDVRTRPEYQFVGHPVEAVLWFLFSCGVKSLRTGNIICRRTRLLFRMS